MRRAPEWAACPAFFAGFADRTRAEMPASDSSGQAGRPEGLHYT
jgi:hypothetical protein